MKTFLIILALAILWITVIGVATRIVNDLLEIYMELVQIRRGLKKRGDSN